MKFQRFRELCAFIRPDFFKMLFGTGWTYEDSGVWIWNGFEYEYERFTKWRWRSFFRGKSYVLNRRDPKFMALFENVSESELNARFESDLSQ